MDITDILNMIEYGHRANIYLSERRATNESEQSTIRLYRHRINYLAAKTLNCLIVSSENRQIFSPARNTLRFIPNLIFFEKEGNSMVTTPEDLTGPPVRINGFLGPWRGPDEYIKPDQQFLWQNSYISSDARYVREMEFNSIHQMLDKLQGETLTPEYRTMVYQEIQQVQNYKRHKIVWGVLYQNLKSRGGNLCRTIEMFYDSRFYHFLLIS
jgi:hypothetical protein